MLGVKYCLWLVCCIVGYCKASLFGCTVCGIFHSAHHTVLRSSENSRERYAITYYKPIAGMFIKMLFCSSVAKLQRTASLVHPLLRITEGSACLIATEHTNASYSHGVEKQISNRGNITLNGFSPQTLCLVKHVL